MTTMKKFLITANGDDAPIMGQFDTYAEAETFGKANSHDWLGTRLLGPSGHVASYKDGITTGYLEHGRWVTTNY